MRKFVIFFAVLFFSLTAWGGDECEQVIPSKSTLFQQYELGANFACLYESLKYIDKAVLAFFSKESGSLISLNESLLVLEDVRNGMNIPAITKLEGGLYQMLWDYPNGVDVVELKFFNGGLYLSGASKEMRLPYSSNGEVKSLTLVSDYPGSKLLPFSMLKFSDVFDKSSLALAGKDQIFNISSAKAFLYSEPVGASRTKAYLVKGDEVRVLDYKAGFLKIVYKMRGGKQLIRWVDLISII